MIAGIFIILCSLGLLALWVRYTCLLLLKNSTLPPAEYPLFNFPWVRVQLGGGQCDGSVKALLDRDYAALVYLIRRTPLGPEARLLAWDYQIMRFWHFLTRRPAALRDMADAVAGLAERLARTTLQPTAQ